MSNTTLRSGHHSYVLTGYFKDKWKASNWTLDYLKKKIPFEWTDYYHENMKDVSKKPHLYPIEKSIPLFQQRAAVPRYLQIRLGLRGWKRLRKDLQPLPTPELFWDDDQWIEKCMRKEDGSVDEHAIDNFYKFMQWKFLVLGEKGSEMFFHKDKSPSTNWYAQILGSKKWTLCPNSESHLLETGFQTFDPDHKSRHPKFSKAKCGQALTLAGDFLYYPGFAWHHPLNLETPSLAFIGALLGSEAPGRPDYHRGDSQNKRFLTNILKDDCAKCWTRGKPDRHCDDISLKWPGAAPPPLRVICDDYIHKCFKLWEDHVKSSWTTRGEL